MLPAAAPTTRQPRGAWSLRDGWTAVRAALVVGWLALALTTVLAGQRPSSLDDLRAAVDAGRVAQVRISAGLEQGATGYGIQVAVWRDGPIAHRTEGWQVSPGVEAPVDSRQVFDTDLAGELVTADPDLRVLPLVEGVSAVDVQGWRLPGWAGLLVLVEWLAALFLLVGGPVPERATRWAWFWFSWNPLGVLAFLLLSGPTPGIPRPRLGARRLTGGWAFLLSLVLGGGYLGRS
ncbi:hypothetical protein GCU67_12710 [Modestobacter muralis]|uniref:Uncharacterized protein n=1 Tax=Modestobacter muralis TaxID=1608614 RepID=A0A6P0HD23_9ACTN|nr:hypothetical protein [Modestobacter muralis]NEK95026.1 hypothetical protein [Modestobacter muralis]NEN51914.1 hypothetical protein [Modestobacter muralis]